ncbi:MAG: hypothetical protein D3916_06845 [Candidatus Electrothrix sp. MAN1_4]|nr:hypothetical protein [Candidatus Electrothrix sp. MAN1_4]
MKRINIFCYLLTQCLTQCLPVNYHRDKDNPFCIATYYENFFLIIAYLTSITSIASITYTYIACSMYTIYRLAAFSVHLPA